MKISSVLGVVFLVPLLAFANSDNRSEGLIFPPLPQHNNTVVRHYSNEQERPDRNYMLQRTVDFPTQIVRVRGDVSGLKLNCDEVEKEIDTIFSNKISPDLFTYNTYINCGYDVDTPEHYALTFSIQSYFDPLTDQAIDYLKSYLQEYNEYNLFNTTPLHIENAKGIIISLNLNAGFKNHPEDYYYTMYSQDKGNFYFKSNFEMRKELMVDIYQRFYSNDPKIILPFLDKWIYASAGSIYSSILKASNYLELQPERIFVMEQGADIFVSDLKFSFANLCMKRNPNKRCL